MISFQVFVPFIRAKGIEKSKKVILFIDNASSHLSIEISRFCEEEGVILIALPPNTTFLLQPIDVGINSSLKRYWRQQVQWERAHNPEFEVTLNNFHIVIEPVLKRCFKPEKAVNSFKSCGLYPFDSNNVKYSRLRSPRATNLVKIICQIINRVFMIS